MGIPEASVVRPLMSLVKERNRAGHQLRLVSLGTVYNSDQNLAEESRAHVGEV